VDLLYRAGLTRRIHLDVGGGYVTFQDVRAKYGTAGINWEMRPNLSTFVSYAYKYQIGDGMQIGDLNSNFVAIGIRWHPRIQVF
jgi:hypothetical protein